MDVGTRSDAMPRRYRTAQAVLEDVEDQEAPSKAKETRMVQRMRSKCAGLGAEELLQTRPDDVVVRKAAMESRLDEEKKLQGGLQFKHERVVDTTVEDPNMIKYVEERFAQEMGREIVPNQPGESKATFHSLQEELYQIPEHLKTPAKKVNDGPTWNTGIQEVELPIEYKLRNIRDTERAAEAHLHKGKGRGTHASHHEPEGNCADDENQRPAKKREALATDDKVAKRFRKRELERFAKR